MEEPETTVVEESPPTVPSKSAVEMLFDKGRLTFVIAVLVAELALFILAIVVPADTSLRQQLVTQGLQSLPSTNTSADALVGLFVANNLRVALLEMIPAVGFFLLPLSIFTSGVIIQGIAVSKAVSPVVVAISYMLLPFTFVELAAYAVAFVSGTMVFVAWRRKRLHREAMVFLLEVVEVAVILTVAAAMEAITIVNPIAGLLLWLPMAGAIVFVVLRATRPKV